MKFKLKKINKNLTEDELISDLKRVAADLGKDSVSQNEYAEHGQFHVTTYQRRFGSWLKSLEMASLSGTIETNITEDRLFSNLANVWTQLGRQPTFREMCRPLSKYSGRPYVNRFGSWMGALEEFVQYMSDPEVETPEKSIASSPQKSSTSTKKRTPRAINNRLRFSVLLRDGFSCKSCGASPLTTLGTELHVDHVLPWSKGGETTLENLQSKCKKCNLGKGNAFDE